MVTIILTTTSVEVVVVATKIIATTTTMEVMLATRITTVVGIGTLVEMETVASAAVVGISTVVVGISTAHRDVMICAAVTRCCILS